MTKLVTNEMYRKKPVPISLRDIEIDLVKTASKRFGFNKSEIIRRAINFALKKKYSEFEKLLKEN